METKIYDHLNNRTIVKNYDESSVKITGDFSASSITTYWVVNKFNHKEPIGIFITMDSAKIMQEHENKKYNTDTFIIINRTIFV